jgi:transcriptional regulator with XRE-family HTH domain
MSSFSTKVRRLRQERNWTQVGLAERLGVHQKQISSYERGVNAPSTEVMIKLAEAFGCTLDYLAFDEAKGQPNSLNLQDRELLRRFEAVDRLPADEKNLAMQMLDLVILKGRFQELMQAGAA